MELISTLASFGSLATFTALRAGGSAVVCVHAHMCVCVCVCVGGGGGGGCGCVCMCVAINICDEIMFA